MAGRNGTSSEDPDKRHAIVEQAIRTFAELGFRGTDVQVIADRAGVGKGTVYRYFGSKEDLFWATTFEVMLRLDQHVFSAMEGIDGACAQLRAAAIAYARFFEENPQYLEVFIQERAEFRGVGPQSHRDHHDAMIAKIGGILGAGDRDGRGASARYPQDHDCDGLPAVRDHRAGQPSPIGSRHRIGRVRHRHFSGGPANGSPLSSREGSTVSSTLTEETVASPSLPGVPRSHKTKLTLEPAASNPPRAAKRRWLWLLAIAAVVGGVAVWRIPALLGTHAGLGAAEGTTSAENAQPAGKASLGFIATAKTEGATSPVETVPAEIVQRSRTLRLTGTLVADERSSVASNTSGIAAEVCVDRGSVVRKGDVLVQIDPTDAKNKLAEGQAMIDELKARLGIEETFEKFVPEDEPEVRLAKASADLAASNFRRAKDSYAKKVDLDRDVRPDPDGVRVGQSAVSPIAVSDPAGYQLCKTAQIKLAIWRRRWPTRRSALLSTAGWPKSSWPSASRFPRACRPPRSSRWCGSTRLRLSLTVPQQDIGSIQPGQIVRFQVDSFPDRTFEGAVRFIAPVVTNDTRSMVVEAVVSNPDGTLRPGLFATAEVELPKKGAEVYVPLSAVQKIGEVARGVHGSRRRGLRAGRRAGRGRPASRGDQVGAHRQGMPCGPARTGP